MNVLKISLVVDIGILTVDGEPDPTGLLLGKNGFHGRFRMENLVRLCNSKELTSTVIEQ